MWKINSCTHKNFLCGKKKSMSHPTAILSFQKSLQSTHGVRGTICKIFPSTCAILPEGLVRTPPAFSLLFLQDIYNFLYVRKRLDFGVESSQSVSNQSQPVLWNLNRIQFPGVTKSSWAGSHMNHLIPFSKAGRTILHKLQQRFQMSISEPTPGLWSRRKRKSWCDSEWGFGDEEGRETLLRKINAKHMSASDTRVERKGTDYASLSGIAPPFLQPGLQ